VATAHHFLGDIFPINEALRDDALVAGRFGPAVARRSAANLDTLDLFAGDKFGHFSRRFRTARVPCFRAIDSAKAHRNYLIANAQLDRVAIHDNGCTFVIGSVTGRRKDSGDDKNYCARDTHRAAFKQKRLGCAHIRGQIS